MAPARKTGPLDRPYVILNAAMSVDGKIATSTGDSKLSSQEDLKRVHQLRASVDGILIGKGTLLADDPKLTVKVVSGRNPQRVIVDSLAATPLDAQVVKTAHQIPTIIGVSSRASAKKVRALENAGVTVLKCGRGERASLSSLLHQLKARGLLRILLEGGGTVNWSMLSDGLVDEVSIAISPIILGGENSVSLVEGQGVETIADGIRLRLENIGRYGVDIVLKYKVLY